MTDFFTFTVDHATEAEIATHLFACDSSFEPPLSQRVDLLCYAEKLRRSALTLEIWHERKLVALLAVYLPDGLQLAAFASNVSVLPAYQARRLGSQLVDVCLTHLSERGIRTLQLEVAQQNVNALHLYSKFGARIVEARESSWLMELSTAESKHGTH